MQYCVCVYDAKPFNPDCELYYTIISAMIGQKKFCAIFHCELFTVTCSSPAMRKKWCPHIERKILLRGTQTPFLRRWYIRIYFTLVVSKYAELKTLVLDTINPDWEISISTMDIFNFLHNPFWVPTNESSLIDYAQNFKIISSSDKTVHFLQSTIFCLHNKRNWVFATLIF